MFSFDSCHVAATTEAKHDMTRQYTLLQISRSCLNRTDAMFTTFATSFDLQGTLLRVQSFFSNDDTQCNLLSDKGLRDKQCSLISDKGFKVQLQANPTTPYSHHSSAPTATYQPSLVWHAGRA